MTARSRTWAARRRLRSITASTRLSDPSAHDASKARDAGGHWSGRAVSKLVWRWPRRSAVVVAGTAALIAGAAGGPVAAVIAAVYVATAVVVVAARRRATADAKAFAAALAAVGAIAADLRAGNDPLVALARVRSRLQPVEADSMSRRVDAALRVAEDTGAPLADLLDRLETDGRTLGRARASATAQASGAQATAWLLAALPAAGIALGTGVGADPVHVLLRTPLGAACAGGAMTFQIVGLAWTQRLADSIKDAA